MSTPLKDMATNRGLRLIQYGRSGAGKSVRASEAARWGKVEYHDFDEQTQNLARYLADVDPSRADKINVVSYAGLSDTAKYKKFLDRLIELKEKKNDVATLVIDSYTRFEFIYAAAIFAGYTPSAGGFGQARGTLKLGSDSVILPGSGDYAVLAAALKKLTGWLKDLGINIIVNAHVRDYLEARGSVIDQGTLAASGQIREFLPTEFTEFHYLFTDDNGKHRVQVKPSRFYLAKTSLTKVPTTGILLDNSLSVFDDVAVKK